MQVDGAAKLPPLLLYTRGGIVTVVPFDLCSLIFKKKYFGQIPYKTTPPCVKNIKKAASDFFALYV